MGGLASGWLLLATPSKVFSLFVPYLILFATVVLAAKSALARLGRGSTANRSGAHAGLLFAGQLAVSLYEGYFAPAWAFSC